MQHSVGTRAAHPLDPLSEAEVTLASDILRREKRLGPDIRFSHVQLERLLKLGKQGIDAVQFRLGDGAPTATNATFKLTVNGVDSNTVMLAVQ